MVKGAPDAAGGPPRRKPDPKHAGTKNAPANRRLKGILIAVAIGVVLLALSDLLSSSSDGTSGDYSSSPSLPRERFRDVPDTIITLAEQMLQLTQDPALLASATDLGEACGDMATVLVHLAQELQAQTDHYDGKEPATAVKAQRGLTQLVAAVEGYGAVAAQRQWACAGAGHAAARLRLLAAAAFTYAIILPDFYTVTEDDVAQVKSALTGIHLLTAMAELPDLSQACAGIPASFEMFEVFCASSLTSRTLVVRRRTAMWELAIALRPSAAPLRLHYAVSLVLGMGRTNTASREFLTNELAKAPKRTYSDLQHEGLLALLLVHCLAAEGLAVPVGVAKQATALWLDESGACRVLGEPLAPEEVALFQRVLQVPRPALFADRSEAATLLRVARTILPEAQAAALLLCAESEGKA